MGRVLTGGGRCTSLEFWEKRAVTLTLASVMVPLHVSCGAVNTMAMNLSEAMLLPESQGIAPVFWAVLSM